MTADAAALPTARVWTATWAASPQPVWGRDFDEGNRAMANAADLDALLSGLGASPATTSSQEL
jgi:hypothetical protein